MEAEAVKARQAKMNAMGMHASGAEEAALQSAAASDMTSYWQMMTGQLGAMAGIGFNPAAGVQAGLTAGQNAFSNQQTSLGNIMGGIGGLKQIYGGGSNYWGEAGAPTGGTAYGAIAGGADTSIMP